MKLVSGLVLRQIAGESILIPTGELTKNFNGLISVNDVSAFILEQLREERTFAQLLEAVLEEFDVAPERAEADLKDLLEKLENLQLLEP